MRLLGRLICAVAAAAVATLAAAYLLPDEVRVSREIVVRAAPERVFQHVNSLQRMAEWSPWIEPGKTRRYTGPKQGVGSRMEWTTVDGRSQGGSKEIVASVANRKIETSVELGAADATASLKLDPMGGGTTRVTWELLAEVGDTPTDRYRALMLRRRVAARYEEGLQRLKALIEAE